jgi:hypothetical protein
MNLQYELALAGFWCVAAHLLLSVTLGWRLRQDSLGPELLVTPDGWLWSRLHLRLLRGRFFLPWVASPPSLQRQNRVLRLIFFLSRATGAGAFVFYVASAVAAVLLSEG